MNSERRNNRGRFNRSRERYSENTRISVLPSPAILESYEEVSPGFSTKFIELVKQEQKHRHTLENKQLKLAELTTRLGQFFGFALCVILVYTTFKVAVEHDIYLASVICLSGFGFLVTVTLASMKFNKNSNKQNNRKINRSS